MVNSIRQFLAPPVFPDDEDKTRAAHVLNALLLSTMGALALASAAAPFVFVERLYNFIFSLTSFSMMAVTYWVMWRGRVRLASAMLVSGIWIVWTVFMPFAGGITSTATIFYVAGTVMAGLLLGERAARVYAVACSLAGLGMVIVEANGHLPSRVFPVPAGAAWLSVTLCLLLMLTALNLTLRGLRDALARARHNEYALEESNRKLEAEIVERRRADEEILRLQHLLQNITDSMPSALITLDSAGRVLTWNPAAEAMTGRVTDQVQGQLLWEACPELVRYRSMFERVISSAQVAHLHKEQLTTEAGAIYYNVSVFPLEAKDLEGVVLRIDDVTRRMQQEEMMLQSAKMASIGGLAAGVAHEINNPLGAIMQSAQMLQLALNTQNTRVRERLQACGVDPQELHCYLQERGLWDYLQGIRDTGARAAKIVTDLLSFSRKVTSYLAFHDLNLLVEQTLELAAVDYDLKKKYNFRDIKVVRELAYDLPRVPCDGQQIQQVILNLVRNAAQAMTGASGELREANNEWRPRLTLRTLRQDEWIRLEVEDNGPGIPEAVRERLFEPFFTTKEVGEGMGLGLWLCWSIVVERHGGRIWGEPVTEGGTRFVIELPAAVGGQG